MGGCIGRIDEISETAEKPFITASAIVYEGTSGGKKEVFYYEAGTKRTFMVSDELGASINPVAVADQSNHNFIAWEDDRDK